MYILYCLVEVRAALFPRLGDVQATLKEQHGRVEDTEDYIKSHLHKERGTVEADRVALRGEVQRIQEQTAAQLQEVEQKLQDSLDKRMDLLEKEVGNHMGQLQVCATLSSR